MPNTLSDEIRQSREHAISLAILPQVAKSKLSNKRDGPIRSIDDFPVEVLLHIFSFLGQNDLARVSQTNKTLR